MLSNLLYLDTPFIYEPKTSFMRKLFFIMLTSTLVFALTNCVGGGPGDSAFDPNDTISRTTALAMYAHYMDSNVNRDDSAIIRQIYPPVSSLKQVLKTKHLVGIKFMIAAYLNDDTVVARRNQPMVMMQLKTDKGGEVIYKYYDLNSLSNEIAPAPPYCPPPPACAVEG